MNRAMFTDLYAFTMAAAYARAGRGDDVVTCEMFARRLPAHRSFMVAAGLSDIASALCQWQLSPGDIRFLRGLPALADALTDTVLARFERIRFAGDVWAMQDGTVFFPDQPVLRITAPAIEAQLVETFVLSVFNHAASVASKAARVVMAARGKPVLEFGMRRVNPDASLVCSRVAYMMGLAGSSNVAAAQAYDIPITGTMAHAFVMVHAREEDAFESFVRAFPRAPVLLVDTYNTLEGVRRAIRVAGPSLGGIRIDSGDLGELARQARGLLDTAGMKAVKVVVSGDLDEHKVAALEASGAPVDVYAVGTELAASADSPTLGAVYKVTHDHTRGLPLAKFSSGKATLAGVHQVYRHLDSAGRMRGDTLAMQDEAVEDGQPLLRPVMKAGALVEPLPSLARLRDHAAAQLAALPPALASLAAPASPYPMTVSAGVVAATQQAHQRHQTAALQPNT